MGCSRANRSESMKTQAQLKEYIAAHPGWNVQRMVNSLHGHGVKAADIHAAMSDLRGKVEPMKPRFGQSLNILVDQFDDVKKVKSAMKLLPKTSFADDDEMRRQLKISSDRWRDVILNPQISSFRYQLPNKKFVWLHQEAQAQLTAAINLDQQ